MASIERTAYPRFKKILTGRELNEFYTPSEEEAIFGRSTVGGGLNLLCFVVFSKPFSVLLFPAAKKVPVSVVNHIRGCLGLPASTEPAYDHQRRLYRHRQAIRNSWRSRPTRRGKCVGSRCAPSRVGIGHGLAVRLNQCCRGNAASQLMRTAQVFLRLTAW